MNKQKLIAGLILLPAWLFLLLSGGLSDSRAEAQSQTGTDTAGSYSSKQREADAEKIGKKSQAFQLQAKEFHGQAEKYLIKTKALSNTRGIGTGRNNTGATTAGTAAQRAGTAAQKAGTAAQKTGTAAQKAGVKMSVPAPVLPQTVSQSRYLADLKRFENHCRQYRLHMADFDKQMRRYEGILAEYRATCRRIDTHIDKFHVPNVERPHVCPNIYMQEELTKASQSVANRDRSRMVNATQALVTQQQELLASRQKHLSAETKALARAELRKLEETEGVLLEREYAYLAREYERLEAMKNKLSSTQP